jgi:hypothetical protein
MCRSLPEYLRPKWEGNIDLLLVRGPTGHGTNGSSDSSRWQDLKGGEANLACVMMDDRGLIVNVHVEVHYVTIHTDTSQHHEGWKRSSCTEHIQMTSSRAAQYFDTNTPNGCHNFHLRMQQSSFVHPNFVFLKFWNFCEILICIPDSAMWNRLCGLVVRVPGYTTEMYCASCEVRTEFINVM